MTANIKQLESVRDYIQNVNLFLLDNRFYLLNAFFIFEGHNRSNN